MNDQKKENSSDSNLNDLLDSALSDFEKVDNNDTEKKSEDAVGDEEIWNEEFFAEQTKLLSEKMNSIFNAASGDGSGASVDQISTGFQKMAEAAAIALEGKSSVDDSSAKYAESISEALKGLKEGVDNLQAPVSETDIANMFSGLNLQQEGDLDGGDINPFLPFMKGMMQSLLSPEILLPSIKELLEKYPKYLENNSTKLSSADKERFTKQQELFKVICDDLESERPDDTAEIKQERFKRVLDHMQKLHNYGQPPEDLVVGDVGSELPPGFPGINSQQQQCPLM